MGSMSFNWQNSEDPCHVLQLGQFTEGRVIKKATWWNDDEGRKDIYAAKDEKTGGTLFGVSKRGRVACLMNTTQFTQFFGNGPTPAELLPVMFLKGKMSPREFAEDLASNKTLSSGLAFYLVVADIHARSMYYISKKSRSAESVETRVVDPGYHRIYFENGLDDSKSPKDTFLEDKFTELGTHPENIDLLMKEIADRLTKEIDESSGPKCEGECEVSEKTGRESHYGSTVVHVTTNGKVEFFEKFGVNDDFESNEFIFDMNSEP